MRTSDQWATLLRGEANRCRTTMNHADALRTEQQTLATLAVLCEAVAVLINPPMPARITSDLLADTTTT